MCSSAASLFCVAAYHDADSVGAGITFTSTHVSEAKLIAKRTGDAFAAALDDQVPTAITRPWDHLATRIVWTAKREGESRAERLGRDLDAIGTTYAVAHRAQLSHVIEFWSKVAGGLQADGQADPDLVAMGTRMLAAFREERGIS